MLSDFQRKNPNRQISARNYQTYLERALDEGRLDEIKLFEEDGAFDKIIQKSGASRFLLLLINAILNSAYHSDDSSIEVLLSYWHDFYNKSPPKSSDLSSFLIRISSKLDHPLIKELSLFLLDKGANPFSYNSSGNAVMSVFKPLMKGVYPSLSEKEQHVCDEKTIKFGKIWLDKIRQNPNWVIQERGSSEVLSTFVWFSLTRESSSSVAKHIQDWIDTLVQLGVNPLKAGTIHGGSPLYQAFRHYGKRQNVLPTILNLLSGPAALSAPNSNSSDFYTSLLAMEKGYLAVPLLARKGYLPWSVDKSSSSHGDGTFLSSFKQTKDNSLDFSMWQDALLLVAKTHPPSSEWLEVSLTQWMKNQLIDLKEKDILSVPQNQIPQEDLKRWKKEWKGWSALANWEDEGLSQWFPRAYSNAHYYLSKEALGSELPKIIEAGLPFLMGLKNSSDALFGSTQKLDSNKSWFHEKDLQCWFHVLNNPKNRLTVAKVFNQAEHSHLKNHIWPAWVYGQLFFKNRDEQFDLSEVEFWIKIFKPQKAFEKDAITLTLKIESTSHYKLLNQALSLGIKPPVVNSDDFWQAFIGPSSMGGGFNPTEKDIFPVLQKLIGIGLELDPKPGFKSPLEIVSMRIDSERFINPLLECGADPLLAASPSEFTITPGALILRQHQDEKRLRLALRDLNDNPETTDPISTKKLRL